MASPNRQRLLLRNNRAFNLMVSAQNNKVEERAQLVLQYLLLLMSIVFTTSLRTIPLFGIQIMRLYWKPHGKNRTQRPIRCLVDGECQCPDKIEHWELPPSESDLCCAECITHDDTLDCASGESPPEVDTQTLNKLKATPPPISCFRRSKQGHTSKSCLISKQVLRVGSNVQLQIVSLCISPPSTNYNSTRCALDTNQLYSLSCSNTHRIGVLSVHNALSSSPT